MNVDHIFEYLAYADTPPTEEGEYQNWLKMNDFYTFVEKTAGTEYVPVLIHSKTVTLYSVLVAEDRFSSFSQDTLNNWDLDMASRALSFTHWGSGDDEWIEVEEPYSKPRDEFFRNADPIYFYRFFSRRRNDNQLNYEFNQRLVHALECHWVESENAFCTINEEGEYVPQMFMSVRGDTKVFFVSKRKLHVYAHYTKQKIIRLFDVHRNRDILGFQEDSRSEEELNIGGGIKARRVIMSDSSKKPSGSFTRGSQIIEDNLNDVQALKIFTDKDVQQQKKYCSYIVYGWKNKAVVEVSCEPGATANYFTESDLPFELSPAFFKPDVLLKYKADPDRYELTPRTINCIGGWYLQTYDINDSGQVTTYPCYLRNLPYSEQLYWKSFNEEPKSGLSERTIKTDFKGEWADAQPIDILKSTLKKVQPLKINGLEYSYFSPSIEDFEATVDSLNIVVTNGLEEWKSETNKLAAICIDTLSRSNLSELSKYLGCHDSKLGSIKSLANCLRKIGVEEVVVKEIQEAFQELWDVRSTKGVAHLGNRPKGMELKDLFADLVRKTASAYTLLGEITGQEHKVELP